MNTDLQEKAQKWEDNRLIAEFMGGTFYEDLPTVMKNHIVSPAGGAIRHINSLKYHSSWDWLMPVAKKCIDSYYDGRQDIYAALDEVDIEKLYKACVAFIHWLPLQPPKDTLWKVVMASDKDLKVQFEKCLIKAFRVVRHSRNVLFSISAEELRREGVEAEIAIEKILGEEKYDAVCNKAFSKK